MVTVASFVLMGGLGLLIFTGAVQLLALGDRRALRAIRDTVATPVGSWAAGTGRVAAAGAVTDGPAGPQVGPVSGEPCPWYRVTLVRQPARGWSGDAEDDVLLEVAAPGPPMIGDRSGRVALDPRLFEDPPPDDPPVIRTTTLVHRRSAPVALPAIVSPELVAGLRRHESLRLTEVRLPYAEPVFALARPVGAPLMLAPNPHGVTVFTPGSREQVLARRREGITTARWITRGAGLTGLTLTTAATALLMVAL